MTFGAIDIGTNSCRLLIAETSQAGSLNTIARLVETTRVGEGVNHSEKISQEAMERTIECLQRFASLLRLNQAETMRTVATSAVREAGNRQEFLDLVLEKTGLRVDILSGEEEANLSYLGVIRGLHFTCSPLVVDVGGGSTEFVCPDIDLLLSVPVGAVRATEANISGDQVLRQLQVLGEWTQSTGRSLNGRPLVFVGGTASSLVTIKKGLPEYKTELVHGETLDRDEIADLYELLEALPLELRRRLPGLQPERADIINKGAMIMMVIMDRLAIREITVSEADILDGIIWNLADG